TPAPRAPPKRCRRSSSGKRQGSCKRPLPRSAVRGQDPSIHAASLRLPESPRWVPFQLVRDTMRHAGAFTFGLQISLWLWFTVLFANFAEAMAEGRGKAQAETLRKARAETQAHRLRSDGSIELVASSKLRSGDVVIVSAGEFIP